MKRITQPILIALLTMLLWSCTEDAAQPHTPSGSRYVRINGMPTAYSDIEVSTRSPKNEFETKLTSLYMLIFDANGLIVGTPEFAPTGVPTFIIDTHTPPFSTHDQTAVKQCDIFLVGNLNEGDLDDVQTLADLFSIEVEATSIHPDADPASKGLVMIGKTADKIDLSLERPSTGNNIQEIAMVSIYAKVVVNLQVQPDQHLPGNDQSFRMISWEVVNAPRYATLGAPDAAAETAPSRNDKLTPGLSGLYSGANPVGVSQSLSYTFYMLEHKRNPVNTVTYPEGIEETAKQRFKNKLVNETTDAAYMIITGTYTDHQGLSHEATYKLYLGANAIDNFHLLRDNQYNNNITIRGVSSNNSFNESTVSFDARVTVNSGPVVIAVKRDTQLDCHYEVRPLDIFVSPGYTVNVAVDPTAQSWIGLDRETVGADGAPVKRDYFTTNLVSTLPKSYGPFTSDFRVWAYFDENSTTADRLGRIVFTCTEDATGNQTIITYTFLQKGLFEVSYNGNTYYIEFHEEYLHNFDPYDPFNNKMDGMSWGLEGVQLSDEFDAFTFEAVWLEAIINSQLKRFITNYVYDFYTPLDENVINSNRVEIHTRSGHSFTQKLTNKTGINQQPLKLTGKVSSAVEYCYNKNKRNPNGLINEADMKWYLPAIDEIEDIVMGAYGTFSDFQNKYYWSSQPAYNHYAYDIKGRLGGASGNGNFFNDNINNARATKVDYSGGNYSTVSSGMSGYIDRYNFTNTFLIISSNGVTANPIPPTNDPGNQIRSNINRIRCVYKRN